MNPENEPNISETPISPEVSPVEASSEQQNTQKPASGSPEKAAPAQGRGSARRGEGGDRGKRGGGASRNRRRRGEGEEKEYQEEVLEVARVTRVVKGGRRLRFRATVIVGNRKGKVGIGTGKSVEVSVAVQKAVTAAKKGIIVVPIENGTIPHELTWKYKAARILLMPAKEGTGIIAGGAVRKIANLAGIDNLLGKSYGTNNSLVNAQAMIGALKAFRGKKQSEKSSEVSEEKEEVAAE